MGALIPVALGGAATASTLAAESFIGTIGNTIFSAIGSQNQAKAESNSAMYNAAVARNNQILANQNATLAAQQGEAQAGAASQKTRAELGGILANQAAAGIDVNSGSAVDVRSSAAELGQLNAINIRANAVRTAYGFQNQAAGFKAEEGLDKANAANSSTAGNINTESTILGGFGEAGSGYGKFLQQNSVDSKTWDDGDPFRTS